MTGTSTWRTISGTARAASSLLTVTRTSSLPAACSALTWATVPSMSAVSVLVMDWTTMGRWLPTLTPPTSTRTVFRRWGALISGVNIPSEALLAGPRRAGAASSVLGDEGREAAVAKRAKHHFGLSAVGEGAHLDPVRLEHGHGGLHWVSQCFSGCNRGRDRRRHWRGDCHLLGCHLGFSASRRGHRLQHQSLGRRGERRHCGRWRHDARRARRPVERSRPDLGSLAHLGLHPLEQVGERGGLKNSGELRTVIGNDAETVDHDIAYRPAVVQLGHPVGIGRDDAVAAHHRGPDGHPVAVSGLVEIVDVNGPADSRSRGEPEDKGALEQSSEEPGEGVLLRGRSGFPRGPQGQLGRLAEVEGLMDEAADGGEALGQLAVSRRILEHPAGFVEDAADLVGGGPGPGTGGRTQHGGKRGYNPHPGIKKHV